MCVLWQPHPNRLQVGSWSADSSTHVRCLFRSYLFSSVQLLFSLLTVKTTFYVVLLHLVLGILLSFQCKHVGLWYICPVTFTNKGTILDIIVCGKQTGPVSHCRPSYLFAFLL